MTKHFEEHSIEYRHATSQDDLKAIRELFCEYAQSLDIDLSFQDFDEELLALPGKYAAPEGILLLALVNKSPAGCIALRKIASDICEMKRLYVRDSFRGFGIGMGLINRVIEHAKKLNYSYMRLDTLPAMERAQALYRSLGFYEIEPYIYNPIPGAIYMELKLK